MKDTMNISLNLEQFKFISNKAQERVNHIAKMWATGYEMEGCQSEVSSLLKLKEEADLRIRDWDNRHLIGGES